MAHLDQAGIDRIVQQELAYRKLETSIAELRTLLHGNLKPVIETPKPLEERSVRVYEKVCGVLPGGRRIILVGKVGRW